jgi:hypothetical protein
MCRELEFSYSGNAGDKVLTARCLGVGDSSRLGYDPLEVRLLLPLLYLGIVQPLP